MTYSHLLSIMKEANLLPEQLAGKLGISGMTVRRWKAERPAEDLPKLYENALINVIYELIAEGKLPTNHFSVQSFIARNPWASMTPAVRTLGVKPETLAGGVSNEKSLMESLSRLGNKESNQSEVDKNKSRILAFKKMRADWAKRISSLWKVVTSTQLNSFDKLVAYGALFYLIYPFDLIPDYIPVVGYMDDYIILGFAFTYYLKRFPKLFPISKTA